MNVDKLALKFTILAGIIALAISMMWPPGAKLKPGIDLAGGHSLLYEIDTSDLDDAQIPGIADKIITQLRKRVDPNNQRNLVWRKVGRTRIEIQMPSTTGKAKMLQQEFDSALAVLMDMNLSKGEAQAAIEMDAEPREAAFTRLLSNVSGQTALRDQRLGLLQEAAAKYDAYREDQTPEALQAFEFAMTQLMNTNLSEQRLRDVLALEANRSDQLTRIEVDNPAYAANLSDLVTKYDAWSANRGLLEDPEDLKRLLRGAGVLEFRIVAQKDTSNPTLLASRTPRLRQRIAEYVEQLEERGPRYRQGKSYQWFKLEDPADFVGADSPEDIDTLIGSRPEVIRRYAEDYYILAYDEPDFTMLKSDEEADSRWKLVKAYGGRDFSTGRQVVYFNLDPRGGDVFGRLTGNNLQRPLGIFLDDVCMSAPNIADRITQRGIISGNFSTQDVAFLTNTLEAGSLPARLKEPPLSERSIGSSLGETNLQKGLRAAIIGLIVVAAFMLVYYLVAGVVANVALALNTLLVLSAMAALEATFTLPGIAAFILTVGMAVDANVLIFERIREELRRGGSLKLAVKNGYDKALSTIVDANITTLITCVILYYAGSEEVKGFAIVLGLGVAISMFTALWVTRWIFGALIQSGLVKSLLMARIVGVPDIKWMAMRRMLWPISLVVVLGGAGLFGFEHVTTPENVYDIEFLGGTAVTVELKSNVEMGDDALRKRIVGEDQDNASGWLRYAADTLPSAKIAPGASPGTFRLSSTDFTAQQLDMMVMSKLSDDIEGGGRGIRHSGPNSIDVSMKSAGYTAEEFKEGVARCAAYLKGAADRLASARVQIDKESMHTFDINTIESNKEVLRQAIVQVMQDELKIQMPINFRMRTDEARARQGFYPITSPEDHRGSLRLKDIIGGDGLVEVDRYRGGVALVFDDLEPPESMAELTNRLETARLLPEFEQYEYRDFEIVPLDIVSGDAALPAADQRLKSFCLLVADEQLTYEEDVALWESELAKPEMAKATAALGSKKTLQRVQQFAEQIAADQTVRAIMAILLALITIVVYIAIRFGDVNFGLAAIVALVHDVSISLGAVAASYYVAGVLGANNFLLINDFKIDLPMIGALLTIVGYSLNDTIVVFDRIRENRGKMKDVNERIINQSINQTLSRTLLTSITTLLAVVVMYVFGGSGIHGFSFAMIVGVLVGTYSSVAVATPLVLYPRVLRWVINIIVAGVLVGLILAVEQTEMQVLLWIALGGFAVFTVASELRSRSSQSPRGLATT